MYSPKIGRNFGRKGGVKGGKYRFKAIILLSDIYIDSYRRYCGNDFVYVCQSAEILSFCQDASKRINRKSEVPGKKCLLIE